MLGLIKRVSRELHDLYTQKTLYTALVKPNLEQSVHSERLVRVQHNFIMLCGTFSTVEIVAVAGL
jgi:hypothetical protein